MEEERAQIEKKNDGGRSVRFAVEVEVLEREQVNKAMLLLECGVEYRIHQVMGKSHVL